MARFSRTGPFFLPLSPSTEDDDLTVELRYGPTRIASRPFAPIQEVVHRPAGAESTQRLKVLDALRPAAWLDQLQALLDGFRTIAAVPHAPEPAGTATARPMACSATAAVNAGILSTT